jgi:hypothetical protein
MLAEIESPTRWSRARREAERQWRKLFAAPPKLEFHHVVVERRRKRRSLGSYIMTIQGGSHAFGTA